MLFSVEAKGHRAVRLGASVSRVLVGPAQVDLRKLNRFQISGVTAVFKLTRLIECYLTTKDNSTQPICLLSFLSIIRLEVVRKSQLTQC